MTGWRPGVVPGGGTAYRPGAAPAAPKPAQPFFGPGGTLSNVLGKAGSVARPPGKHSGDATNIVGPPPAVAPPPPPAADPYGTESGPTYLEKRYLDRLNGEDAAYNYALKRGGDDIDRRMAAAGSYNSGARGQQLSDFAANVFAKSQSQLDDLAAGATGARQRKLEGMFNEGLGLANGQSGVQGSYDRSLADFTSQNNLQNIMMLLNKGGVDSKGNQAGITNILTSLGLLKGLK